jgi:Cu(I)/Ag(I) efflux system membrane fusion protein
LENETSSREEAGGAPPPRRGVGIGTVIVVALVSAGLAAGATYLALAGHSPPAASGAGPAAPAQRYQCPMHPNIVQDRPGDCPVCGMKLVKVEAGKNEPDKKQAAAAGDKYQCPMHPSIVQDRPGECPICGMKLVKVEAEESAPRGLATVDIDPARQQLIGLHTSAAASGSISGSWRTVGRVAVDETRVRHINIKVPGYVEKIYVNYVGRPVRKGGPLFSIYSPELLAAQEEYLIALRSRRALARGALATDGDALTKAARRKLALWDVPASAIARLEQSGEPTRLLTLYSPVSGVVVKKEVVEGMRLEAGAMPYEIVDLSTVWFLADVYESDLHRVKIGLPATLALKGLPGREFQGKVLFIDPMLDPKTRTAKVRLAFPNPQGELRPEMFGEAVLRTADRQALRIPEDAVIDSGTEKIVFVALGKGKFQPRTIKTGESGADHVEVLSGLKEGERVVTRANFLVDSESRLRASLAELSAAKPKESARVLPESSTAPKPVPDDAPAGGAPAHKH